MKAIWIWHRCRCKSKVKSPSLKIENETTQTFSRLLAQVQFFPPFQYNNYDGRDNIRVGTGRFYPRDYGRTIEVECIFPSGSTLISSIKWFRKSFGRSRRRNRGYYPGRSSNDKYQIQSMGPNGSILTIRDYNSFEDDGVYRCFAMRSSRYGSGRPESVYVETDVTYRNGGYQGGCGGGFSACGWLFSSNCIFSGFVIFLVKSKCESAN